MVNARQAAWRFGIEPASDCPRLYPKGLGSCHEKTGAPLTTIYLFQPGCGHLLPLLLPMTALEWAAGFPLPLPALSNHGGFFFWSL